MLKVACFDDLGGKLMICVWARFALFPGQTSKHSENVNIMSVELEFITTCFDWL